MARILVTGASGYLGSTLIPTAASLAEVVGAARDISKIPDPAQSIALDITDKKSVVAAVEQLQPTAIIHAAASNPGVDESTMEAVNHQGARNVAIAAEMFGCRLVAMSSDVVHNGADAPYSDHSEPSPLPENIYACSKARGEKAVHACCSNAIVVRTSLIYGLNYMDRGTEGFKRRLESGQPLELFDDVLRQPVWVDALAESLCSLALDQTDVVGTINIAGDQVLTRSQFARIMLQWWNISNDEYDIRDISGKNIAGLPLDLRVHCELAEKLGFPMPGVQQVLTNHTWLERSDV